MTNKEKYTKIFTEMFSIKEEDAMELEYMKISEWDSVGHMSLIAELEDEFGITMDTDDIIDFSSYKKGMEILSNNYNIQF